MNEIFNNPDFSKFYQPFLDQVISQFNKKRGQFMIVSPDITVLDYIVRTLKQNCEYKFVEVKKQKDEFPENKIFIINLNYSASMEYQAFLYYYFELPLHYDCFVCIVTNSSNALNSFEKRVMSRFKNKIFFFPYYSICKDNLDKSKCLSIYSSLRAIDNLKTIEKYGLDKFSLSIILNLFEPVHFVLIMISFLNKLSFLKAYDYFKAFVVDTPELKKAPAIRIYQCVLDLFESNIINENGIPLINYNEFKNYIEEKGTQYLKKLIRVTNKKIKI